MGIIEEYINSSLDEKLEWIRKTDEAISKCSKRELKGRLRLIKDLEKEIKKSISPEDLKKLTELSLEIQNLVKLCVMTGASNEREIKLEHFDCKICGNCCRESFPILVRPEEIDKITFKYGKSELNNIVKAHINDIWGNLTEEAKMEIKSGRILPQFDSYKFKKTRPCKYLDERTNKCLIYDSRPIECRNFPILPKEAENIDYDIHYFCLGEFEFYIRKILTVMEIINELY